jgi:hypothetical protein
VSELDRGSFAPISELGVVMAVETLKALRR